MDAIISMQDIRTTLGGIARRAEQGESFTVIKNSKPAFRIVPLEKPKYAQGKRSVMTLKEIRAVFDATPMSKEELTPEELDDIIHEIHKDGGA